MLISNWKNPFVCTVYTKLFQLWKGWIFPKDMDDQKLGCTVKANGFWEITGRMLGNELGNEIWYFHYKKKILRYFFQTMKCVGCSGHQDTPDSTIR